MPIAPLSVPGTTRLPALPARAEEILLKILTGEVLGASHSIRLINQAFCIQADESQEASGLVLASHVRQWADYLVQTRGALSPAVGNAIHLVLRGLEKASSSDMVEDVRTFLHIQVETYNRRSIENVQKIAQIGANLLADGQAVMAYDYSSSVTQVLYRAAENGKHLKLVIPESRALNGGLPILREILPFGHDVLFTVDAAMGQELKSCQAVLVGAESLTAEGGFWTTVGTCSAAILAQYHRVPFYVPTELIKFDLRSGMGIYRKVERVHLSLFDFQDLAPLLKRVKVECDDLEYTPRELVTAYITEQGLLPPEAMFGEFQKMVGTE
ncbi:MAG: translation initiation factor eIF-2B [Chloroflexi bacterium]|nr:translation initiation factor eIF-2B [Chloroflexota bacterium]